MQRQVYGLNPATGRVEHFYRDEGAARVTGLRGSMLVPRDARTGDNRGRVVKGAGS